MSDTPATDRRTDDIHLGDLLRLVVWMNRWPLLTEEEVRAELGLPADGVPPRPVRMDGPRVVGAGEGR